MSFSILCSWYHPTPKSNFESLKLLQTLHSVQAMSLCLLAIELASEKSRLRSAYSACWTRTRAWYTMHSLPLLSMRSRHHMPVCYLQSSKNILTTPADRGWFYKHTCRILVPVAHELRYYKQGFLWQPS